MAEESLLNLLASNAAPRAEFAYIDDTGDPGRKEGSSTTFGLGCVLVPTDHWTSRLDLLTELRRDLKKRYGLLQTQEVKGEWISGVKKHFRDLGLGDGQLRDIYTSHLKATQVVSSGSFAVIIQKDKVMKRDLDIEEWAWKMLFQRLRLRSRATNAPIVVIHDNGSRNDAIRAHLRRFRRFDWVAGAAHDAPLLIEDASPRDSQQSYFVQLADLAAFSASRRITPAKGKRGNICHPGMWNELGSARLAEVSPRGDGIVAWP
ncbi:DUF3800 domain-containing protein [Nocardioides sp.]|uniref:DUF3800 domain-containing protein n=1 Tax=Nocardioides sp. TaxID=35761 RepID=UPI003515611C